MQGFYSNTTTTSSTPTASGCDVKCDIILLSLEYYRWADGIKAVNQTAVTVIVDVSPNTTQTSTRSDTQMMKSYYDYGQFRKTPANKDAQIIFGAEENISLSISGTVV